MPPGHVLTRLDQQLAIVFWGMGRQRSQVRPQRRAATRLVAAGAVGLQILLLAEQCGFGYGSFAGDMATETAEISQSFAKKRRGAWKVARFGPPPPDFPRGRACSRGWRDWRVPLIDG